MYPRLAAKYLEKSLRLFDEKIGLSLSRPAARLALESGFEKLVDELSETSNEPTEGSEGLKEG